MLNKLLISVSIAILFSFTAFAQTDKDYLLDAEKFSQGDYKQAIVYFTKAIELNPNYANAYFYALIIIIIQKSDFHDKYSKFRYTK